MGSQSQSQSHSQSKQPNEDDGCSDSTAGQQTELVELCVTVQHAAAKADDSPADEDRAVEGLQAMLKCHVSTEILMATQVGKIVRKLSKQHSGNTRIHMAAQQVMEKWKAVVAAEAQAKPAATGHANASSKDGAAAEHSGKQKAEKDKVATLGGSGSKKEGGLRREDVHERGSGGAAVKNSDNGAGLASPRGSNPSTPRSSSQDGAKARALPGDAKVAPGNAGGNSRPSPGGGGGGGGRGGGAAPGAAAAPVLKPVPYTGHATRDKLRDLLVQALSLVAGEVTGSDVAAAAAVDLVDACVAVEKELWRLYGGTKDLKDYKAKYRSISFNLKDPRNPDLRRRVLLGEISAAKLVTMTAEEMASDAQRAANAETKRKLTEEAVRGQQTAASTDQFKCGRCGQRKCTYFQMQTRSADEPMTTFVTCMNCNNRWKFC